MRDEGIACFYRWISSLAISAKQASAYEHWVGSEELSFRARDDAERLGDVVEFHWAVGAKYGEVFAVGLNFLVLVADGRIERDYTFVVARGMGAALLGEQPLALARSLSRWGAGVDVIHRG